MLSSVLVVITDWWVVKIAIVRACVWKKGLKILLTKNSISSSTALFRVIWISSLLIRLYHKDLSMDNFLQLYQLMQNHMMGRNLFPLPMVLLIKVKEPPPPPPQQDIVSRR